jgi:hypothetical protein
MYTYFYYFKNYSNCIWFEFSFFCKFLNLLYLTIFIQIFDLYITKIKKYKLLCNNINLINFVRQITFD